MQQRGGLSKQMRDSGGGGGGAAGRITHAQVFLDPHF